MTGDASGNGIWTGVAVMAAAGATLLASGCGAPNRHRIATGNLTEAPSGDSTIELAPRVGEARIDVGGIGGASPSPRVIDETTAREGVGSIVVTSGDPEDVLFEVTDSEGAADRGSGAGAPARRIVDRQMIDSVVGQINGLPVFASDFFEPMDAKFRAEAKTKSTREWLEMAQKEIQGRLRDLVRDELLLAEFESSLSIEQRSGLLYFVSQIRENLVSASRGSEELLAQKLLEEEGLTIDEKVERERRTAFIREQLRNKLGDKAYVPWRDVVLQYKQDESVYRPAPTAHLRLIQVGESDPEAVERVEAALEAGEDFGAIAGRESLIARSRGGAVDVELTGGTYEGSQLFGPASLDDAARGLKEGDVVGPITMENGRLAWIKLDSIETNVISLYDVQFAIHEALRDLRLAEEESKYFQGLISRSSLSPFEDMQNRLLEIASTRYLIDGMQ